MRSFHIFLILALTATSALSQGKIFRCGLEYVSPATAAEERDAFTRGCRLIEGGASEVSPRGPSRILPREPIGRAVPLPPVTGSEPSLSSTGTGFFVSPQGHLISNAHVVKGCHRLVARRATGEVFPVDQIATDERNDLALLKVSGTSSGATSESGAGDEAAFLRATNWELTKSGRSPPRYSRS